jgi:hypothetical protein
MMQSRWPLCEAGWSWQGNNPNHPSGTTFEG